jgi:hypothetical protein
MRAFDQARSAGWEQVDRALSCYGIMPAAFSSNPAGFYESLARSIGRPASPVPAFA